MFDAKTNTNIFFCQKDQYKQKYINILQEAIIFSIRAKFWQSFHKVSKRLCVVLATLKAKICSLVALVEKTPKA